jgi:hypothetical protein
VSLAKQRKQSEALGELLNIGSMMSNLCFNLAQREVSEPMRESDISTANEMRVKWDTAKSKYFGLLSNKKKEGTKP